MAKEERVWLDLRPLGDGETSTGLLELDGMIPYESYRFRIRWALREEEEEEADAISPASLVVRMRSDEEWRSSPPRELSVAEVSRED